MQQLLYHTPFEQNEVTNLASIDRSKPQKSSASSRYQQHRQKRRRQQRHQPPSTHQQQHQHNQQKTPKNQHHHHQQQQQQLQQPERNSDAAATLRHSRKSNQSNFKQKVFGKIMQNLQGRLHKNLLQPSTTTLHNPKFISPKISMRLVCVARRCADCQADRRFTPHNTRNSFTI